ncbi:MAG: NDP-sugar synthase [Elusimicrobia bacterium]|nr:NDP-sugar synthase [Elusimicrobiota bacterium]
MQALILTGGLGTRLRPLTLYTPKGLLPIQNIPYLSCLFAILRKHKIFEGILCASNSLNPYQNLNRQEMKNGTKVRISKETRMLGTAGGIKNAQKFIHDSPFFVINGDVLTDIDLTKMFEFHRKKKALATIALIKVKDPSSYGLVRMDSSFKVKKFIEKPAKTNKNKKTFINAGIYLFEKEILSQIPNKQSYSIEKEFFPNALKNSMPLFGFPCPSSTYWLDIGTPQKYIQANIDFQKKFLSFSSKNKIKKSNRIPMEKKYSDAVIGKNCKIGKDTILKSCVLLDHVEIENNCVLENCILGSHVKIGHHSSIRRSQIIGNYSQITPYSLC